MLLLDFGKWIFINIMVATGLTFLAVNPPFFRRLQARPGYPWHAVFATSLMVIFCILFPWENAPGFQIDIRTVPMALLGWTRGMLAALPVGALIIVVRFIKGGFGAYTTLVFTVMSFAILPFFRKRPRTPFWLAAHGVAQVAIVFVFGQLMVQPSPPGMEPTSPFWLILAGVTVLAFWLLNAAMEQVNQNLHLEQALADELRSKQAVLELIPYGILFLNGAGRIAGANEAARILLEGGKLPSAVCEHPEITRALREHRRLSGIRITYPGREGERIVLISAVPLHGGGAVLGIENVTGVIREEREEAERNRLELLGKLAAMAAHEIKNPLTTIKGFMQILARRPEFASHQTSFQLVQAEVEHINRVVGDFLLLSSTPTHHAAPVRVDQVLQEVLDVMDLQFPGNGVQVVLAGDAGLVVQANSNSVKQIFKNLVTNAFEAMPDAGRLIVSREALGGEVLVTVQDTGPGLTPEVLAMLFTPYMTTKATGTGLGLVICHKLATDLGGRLEVASERGKGCCFRLWLPASPAAMQEAAAASMGI